MMRFIKFCALALSFCFGCAFHAAVERPAHYLAFVLGRVCELYGVSVTRMHLTLALWRTGSQSTDETLKSNLRASSNHFVMTSAKPMPESYGLSPC
jgi:hypothetical protein